MTKLMQSKLFSATLFIELTHLFLQLAAGRSGTFYFTLLCKDNGGGGADRGVDSAQPVTVSFTVPFSNSPPSLDTVVRSVNLNSSAMSSSFSFDSFKLTNSSKLGVRSGSVFFVIGSSLALSSFSPKVSFSSSAVSYIVFVFVLCFFCCLFFFCVLFCLFFFFFCFNYFVVSSSCSNFAK
jgi:hypothetical protein